MISSEGREAGQPKQGTAEQKGPGSGEGREQDRERQAGSRKITRPEAERMSKKMRAAGATYQEIAAELTTRGWRSLTGGPATIGGVASLLGRRPFTRGNAAASPTETNQARMGREVEQAGGEVQRLDGHRHMLEIIEKLLSNSTLAISDRVAACQMLIGAHLQGNSDASRR